MNRLILFILLFCIALSCTQRKSVNEKIWESLGDLPQLTGKPNYLKSPYTSAGDRVYLIGNQDGTFPDMGWHVEGEMGGIWMHPIKLMDGFTSSLTYDGETICLDNAISFTNYPIGNLIDFGKTSTGIHVKRLQFVPDGKEGLVIFFHFQNVTPEDISFDFLHMFYIGLFKQTRSIISQHPYFYTRRI